MMLAKPQILFGFGEIESSTYKRRCKQLLSLPSLAEDIPRSIVVTWTGHSAEHCCNFLCTDKSSIVAVSAVTTVVLCVFSQCRRSSIF